MKFTKEQISELICKHAQKENGLHDLMEIMLESMMVAERDEFLTENQWDKGNGYRPGHAYGHGKKLEFRIPRDRYGNFHPRILAILRDQEEECDRLAGVLYTKGLTQEQAAEHLNVNAQTVSRWECGNTLPDALTLPVIASLYEVTVDDLYRKSNTAYDNFAQRLASVYEKSRDPEDFMRCRTEYEKLIKNGELSTEDKWLYAWIHMYMMNYCRDIALEWYDKAVSDDPNDDPENYQLATMQRMWMYFLLKREDEIISELEEKIKAAPDNPRNADNLIIALIWQEKYDEAYSLFRESVEKLELAEGDDVCAIIKSTEVIVGK